MRYLIDTQALVYYLKGEARLPREIRDFINDYDNQGFVSVLTLHELVIKSAKNQIHLSQPIKQIVHYLNDAGIQIVSIVPDDVVRLAQFERESVHKDPFDCLLIAQCIANRLTFLTSDAKIPLYAKYGLEYIQYEIA